MKSSYTLQAIEGKLLPAMLAAVQQLYVEIFAASDKIKIEVRLQENANVLTLLACWDGASIGFKIGYTWPTDVATYYSWLGGVLPAHRGKGVARALMQAQHDWAYARGYIQVRMHTLGANAAMLALNASFGYVCAGHEQSQRGEKLILLRRLS